MLNSAQKSQNMKSNQNWFVYILACANGTYYTGITTDLVGRVAKHNAGTGAKYTNMHKPVALAYTETSENRSLASKREWEIKQLTHTQKKALIDSNELIHSIVR